MRYKASRNCQVSVGLSVRRGRELWSWPTQKQKFKVNGQSTLSVPKIERKQTDRRRWLYYIFRSVKTMYAVIYHTEVMNFIRQKAIGPAAQHRLIGLQYDIIPKKI